jgi:hypothetical protein
MGVAGISLYLATEKALARGLIDAGHANGSTTGSKKDLFQVPAAR